MAQCLEGRVNKYQVNPYKVTKRYSPWAGDILLSWATRTIVPFPKVTFRCHFPEGNEIEL